MSINPGQEIREKIQKKFAKIFNVDPKEIKVFKTPKGIQGDYSVNLHQISKLKKLNDLPTR